MKGQVIFARFNRSGKADKRSFFYNSLQPQVPAKPVLMVGYY